MQTSLNITYADSSLKKSTKSLTYINPEATNAQLETAASLFSAISQNSYVGAERIDRIDVSEPEPTPPTKPEPTCTFSEWTDTTVNDNSHTMAGKKTTITTNSDATPYIHLNVTDASSIPQIYTFANIVDYSTGGTILSVVYTREHSFNGQIIFPETENFAAKSFDFSYTQS